MKSDEQKARELCFSMCSKGEFLDYEAGCASVCKSTDKCTTWRAYLHNVSGRTDEEIAALPRS